jgi:uncharacterized C2H2 Zn-finger protein
MSTKHITTCPSCFKIFKRAGCYEKHIFVCQRTNETAKTPNTKQLYDMINTLTEKYNTVQSELECLKRHIYTKNRKLEIIPWLNEQEEQPKYKWSTCMENMKITTDDLSIIFKNGFINGVFELVNKHLLSGENLTVIKCFEQKKNIIYVFDGEWVECSQDNLKNIFTVIYNKLLITFDLYKNENKRKLENDEQFQLEYLDNYMKLVDMNMPFETACNRIKNKIYMEHKESFKSITSYDI